MPFYLKKILDFILFSNIWVGLTAACFSLLGSRFFNSEIAFYPVLFSTQFLYTFQRLYKLKVLNLNLGPQRQTWFRRHEKFLVYWMILNAFLTLFCLQNKWTLLLDNGMGVVVFGGISLFYVIPFYRSINLRNVPMAKGFLVTMVYAWFTLWLFNSHTAVESGIWFLIFGSLYVLAATLMFDWRDRNLDDQKMKTIPQLMGGTKSLVLVGFLYTLSIIGMYGLDLFGFTLCVSLIVLHLASVFLLWKRENDRVLSFLFEGLMAVLGLLVYWA